MYGGHLSGNPYISLQILKFLKMAYYHFVWQGYLKFSYYSVFGRIVCVFGDLPMKTLRDANHKEFESQSWTYLRS